MDKSGCSRLKSLGVSLYFISLAEPGGIFLTSPTEVVAVAEPVCWTEVPDNLTILSRQRKRWQRGALETFFKHRKMLMNPRYGRVGTIGMPFSLLIDVIGPLVEVLGYILVPLLWFSGMLNPTISVAKKAVSPSLTTRQFSAPTTSLHAPGWWTAASPA